MNNRKQQINSFLNSLTTKEINTYLKENNINKNMVEQLELARRYKDCKNQTSHKDKLLNDIFSSFNSEDLIRFGQSYVIAGILYYGLQKDFDIKDFVKVYNDTLDNDIKLKEMVYEIMKDF